MNIMWQQPPYPVDSFYDLVRFAIYEVQRQTQAPFGVVASSVLTAMAITCQLYVDVMSPTGGRHPVSVNLLTIAERGERKTTCDRLVLKPIYDHDQCASVDYEQATRLYGIEHKQWAIEDRELQKKLAVAVRDGLDLVEPRAALAHHDVCAPVLPIKRCILYENVTARAMFRILQGCNRSIALQANEGDTLFRAGALQWVGILNNLWDGSTRLSLERSEESIEAVDARALISVMVQPDVFSRFIERRGASMRLSGHLSRYLVSYPVSTQGTRTVSIHSGGGNALASFQERVKKLLDASNPTTDNSATRRVLYLTQEAKREWTHRQQVIECEIRPGGSLECIRDFASKAMEITCRVAAIFHYFNDEGGDRICLETFQRAAAVVDWYIAEFRRLFGGDVDIPRRVLNAAKVYSFLRRKYDFNTNIGISKRDLQKYGPTRDPALLNEALCELTRGGYIAVAPGPNGRLFVYAHIRMFGLPEYPLSTGMVAGAATSLI